MKWLPQIHWWQGKYPVIPLYKDIQDVNLELHLEKHDPYNKINGKRKRLYYPLLALKSQPYTNIAYNSNELLKTIQLPQFFVFRKPTQHRALKILWVFDVDDTLVTSNPIWDKASLYLDFRPYAKTDTYPLFQQLLNANMPIMLLSNRDPSCHEAYRTYFGEGKYKIILRSFDTVESIGREGLVKIIASEEKTKEFYNKMWQDKARRLCPKDPSNLNIDIIIYFDDLFVNNEYLYQFIELLQKEYNDCFSTNDLDYIKSFPSILLLPPPHLLFKELEVMKIR